MEEQKFAIYILGAGFSCAAGLPLANDLWREVRKRAERMTGRAAKFTEDLESYIEFKKACDGVELTKDDVDFEEFLGFLDIEYYLGLRGSDTWSSDGNETQVVIKTLIAQIITELVPDAQSIPPLYSQFAKKLKPGDYVLTFNYDNLLERALDAACVSYRLFPDRYKSVGSHGATIDPALDEVVVLKLHGSIDWFDKTSHLEHCQDWRTAGNMEEPQHPIFNCDQKFHLSQLLDGPRLPDDPLQNVYRLKEIEGFYRDPSFFLATPLLITPSTAKVIYAKQFRDFWWGAGGNGILNFRMVIIGYSLSVHDDYARQVIYRMVKNYQENYWDEGVLGKRKEPLLVVDYRPTDEGKEDILKRYSFVNWDRGQLLLEGFNEDIVTRL